MSFKSLFNDTPTAAPVAVSKASLFGGQSTKDESLRDIEGWLLLNPDAKVAAGRILFNLNAMKVESITMNEVGTIGDFTIAEATEASKCLEEVVTDFADLKPYLDEPKAALKAALEVIEGDSKPKGLLSVFRRKSSPTLTPVEVRQRVKANADRALSLMQACVKYRLDPFIEGLGDATYHCDDIAKSLNESYQTLQYVNQRSNDQGVKDLALRRAEMVNKSSMLMELNKGQLNQMTVFCQKNKAFLTELETSIIPLLDNIMRSAVIGNVSGDGMEDIAVKMRGLIQ